MHPGRWWHRLDDGRIQCDPCPRGARVAGRFGAIAPGFGRRRIPLRLEAAGGEP
ncbi:MAG TPA: hypothetical protein VLK85_32170 [Ramlibacter sp.]|nr:hypothetical protein [Ramlibacter sp.]